MVHTIKMLLQGRKNQRSFKIISCEKKLITSKTQINLGFISHDTLKIDWNSFWLQIQHGAKINQNLRIRLYNLRKIDNISLLDKDNIKQIQNKHCL